jgi:diguanylate cyclase (GGDEF)-like protein
MPPTTATGDPAASGPSTRFDWIARVPGGRRALAAALAVACVAGGVVGSLLGARSVAHTDASNARQSFQQTSLGIGSTLKLSIQHEEDLLTSAATFFAGHPEASPAEFAAWARWAQALHRYPELDRVALVALVPAPDLLAFEARISGHPLPPGASTTATAATGATTRAGAASGLPSASRSAATAAQKALAAVPRLRIVPAGNRPYYCFGIAGLARGLAKYPPKGVDYCAVTPGLYSSRASGHDHYTQVTTGHTAALSIDAPVYRGSIPPPSVAARVSAFVGWLREILVPKFVLDQALRGHPQEAVRLRYRSGSSNLAFASGTPAPEAQSSTTNLHGGWTARVFGPAVTSGVLDDGDALALLIAGAAGSVLLGLLAFTLGAGRAPRGPRTAKLRPVVQPDLYDELTGLPNRALTLDLAERMVARVGRQSGMLGGALLVDVDWFRQFDEKLGEGSGDQVLQVVADRLQAVVRAHDTVGRLEGDRFVALVEAEARGAKLESLARRIIDALHKPVELEGFGPGVYLSASIGVAFGRYGSVAELLRDAELALNDAKAAGKDRYTLFNANMRSLIEDQGVLEAELNKALQERQFFLLYQPVFDLSSHKVVGLEALIRWQHPTRGVLLPGDFIGLAEETGLTVPIGRWALEEACTRAAAWNVAGHRVGVSVMISANQLHRDGFATDVRRALQQSGIDPALLTLEIAEETVMRDLNAAGVRLREAKNLGVTIAIDDFGNGYAYRADLQRLPLDYLKVDRSALAASEDEDYRNWLLEAILVFARDLSLSAVAKGIETFEQLENVRGMGCSMAQGFFLAKPAPADAVESLFGLELPARASDGSADATLTRSEEI